ncbi:MAG: S49 family peptidase, partial [Acidilobaceae archaeon]
MLGASNSWRLLLAALILLAVLLAATGALVALLVSLTAIDLREDYVAVVELSGAIDYSYGGLFSGPVITPHSVETLVERVLSDPRARAVVIVVNSPGGTAAAFEVYEILRKLYEERVVVVYITGLGASGGYLISLPSHAIVAHPTAIVGSVGAIGILVSYKELLDKLGIDAEVVVSGDLKDFASPFKEIESEDVELLSRIIRDVADYFVSLVEKHRGDRI